MERGWNAEKFSSPYDAVSIAQCFYKLSDPAKIALEAVYSCVDGGEFFSKSGLKINLESVVNYLLRKFRPVLRRDDVKEVIGEIRWFVREVEYDFGAPKPVTAFERRRARLQILSAR